jgi:hypothetical protein
MKTKSKQVLFVIGTLFIPAFFLWVAYKPGGAYTIIYGRGVIGILVLCFSISLIIKLCKYIYSKIKQNKFDETLFIRPAIYAAAGLAAILHLNSIDDAAKYELKDIALKIRDECTKEISCPSIPKTLSRYAKGSQYFIYPKNVPYQIVYKNENIKYTVSLCYGFNMVYTITSGVALEPKGAYGEL